MKFIIISLIVTPIIYFAISITLVFFPFNRNQPDKSLDFDVLDVEANSEAAVEAEEKHLKTRDGSKIFYRFLPGETNVFVVLVHGSGSEGR